MHSIDVLRVTELKAPEKPEPLFMVIIVGIKPSQADLTQTSELVSRGGSRVSLVGGLKA